MKRHVVLWLIFSIFITIGIGLMIWGQINSRPSVRLLSREELLELPIGTKIWVEYNRERFDKLPDSAMVREKIEGVGEVIRTPEGYWALDDKLDFGVTYRVWERMPSFEDRLSVRWDKSPWE